MNRWSFLAIGLVLGVVGTLGVDRVVLKSDVTGQAALHTNEDCVATSGELEQIPQNSFQTEALQQGNAVNLDSSALAPSPHDDVFTPEGEEGLTGEGLPQKDLVNKVVPMKSQSNEF